jgi:hypothetical protein
MLLRITALGRATEARHFPRAQGLVPDVSAADGSIQEVAALRERNAREPYGEDPGRKQGRQFSQAARIRNPGLFAPF